MRIIGRKIAVLLLLVLCIMGGCGKPVPTSLVADKDVASLSSDTAPITTTLIQASPTGVTFMLANGIAESLNKTYPGSVLNITPGSPTSNILRLFTGEAEFVMTYNTSSLAAVQGKGSEPHPELKAIAAMKTSPVQFVLRKDIEALTFEDMIAKKIKVRLSVGLKESVSEQAFVQVLQQYNLTMADMKAWGCVFVNKGIDDTERMFTDGAIDGYFWCISVPSPSIIKNAIDKPLRFIAIDPKVIEAVCTAYGYEKTTIPAGTYTFQSEDYHTFTDYLILATTDQVSNEKTYKMTRAIHQNLEYITLIHANLKDLTADSMVNQLRIPIHSGALQYYKEVGLVK